MLGRGSSSGRVRAAARRAASPGWRSRPVRLVRGWGEAAVAPLADRWHRSVQVRVVATTLTISIVVVAVLGFFLMQQAAGALLQNTEQKSDAVVAEGQGLALRNPAVGQLPTSSEQVDQTTHNIAQELQPGSAGTSGQPGSDYFLAVLPNPQLNLQSGLYSHGWTTLSSSAEIPHSLVRAVSKVQETGPASETSNQSVTLRDTRGQPVLAVGVPLGPYYQLYYFFPLDEDQVTLSLIQRTLILAGLVLVALLAAIASMVTRWVVLPVRQVAQAAQRVSAGDLGERLQVHGHDDLAALATSFNEMAGSLQDKLAELQDLSQVQRQFVSDVSHELRTPLTTIKIAADVLFAVRNQLDGAAARSAELLLGQVERFEALLTDLLEISRYDANAATLEAEPVDICDLARRSADVAQHLAERRGSRLEFRLPAGPCIADADRRRVERILRNLLVNAVEHGEGRDVVVTVAGDRDAVAVAVRDYGVGLRPGEDLLVFDRFWRADPARARSTGGTGLGLSIALEDARLHGGWLEAWGDSGRGSVFRLTLPRVAGARLEGSPLPLRPSDAELVPLHELTVGPPLALPADVTAGDGERARRG
ncbi:MAG TPA: MtrAB system histidine kinase MtrB [Streptosporangiaceae bacterium]